MWAEIQLSFDDGVTETLSVAPVGPDRYRLEDHLTPTPRSPWSSTESPEMPRITRHVKYGVLPEHYPMVGSTLLKMLEHYLGEGWTPAVHQAWADAYTAITT